MECVSFLVCVLCQPVLKLFNLYDKTIQKSAMWLKNQNHNEKKIDVWKQKLTRKSVYNYNAKNKIAFAEKGIYD